MASNDKLWFELGVRDDVTKVLENIIGKANDLQKALSITGKKPLIPGIKESYDNVKKLEIAIEKIRGAIRSVRTAKMSVTDPKDIANLDKMQAALEQMRSRVKDFMNEVKKKPNSIKNEGLADSFLSGIGFNTAITQATNRVKDYEVALKNNTRTTKESAQVNESLIRTYNEISKSGKSVNVFLTQMQQQIASFTSLYGIERLLKNVITIGGQFEFQHIALQNILGDVQQANTLFGQLQTLAIESPKTFMELTSYTKQLSAYQIPYEELFDTTKRLADLSTGLGVDMSRLILAYGQVRSAAVLRGQELRQFTEAGIPLVQKLAEEFTKLNGKVTTTGDVFELISKRAVPFEMVKKILWDMTSEGGQFYNMQAELADTLYGKWQKLQDQWQITLGHIADGEKLSGRFLKNTLEGVVKLVSLFDTILPMFSMFTMGKIGYGIFNKGQGIFNKYTGRTAIDNMQLAKQREAANIEKKRLWYGKQLTAEEQKLVRYKDMLVARDMKLLLLQGEITEKQLAQLANAGKLSKLELYRLLRAQGYTLEQWKQIKNGNLQMLKGGESFMSKIGKGALGMMGGWFGVAMTAAGFIMSAQSNASQKTEEAANAAKGATDNLLKDLKEVNTLYNELSNKPQKTSEERAMAINRMSEALKEVNAYTPELEKNLEKASDSEKYVILYKRLEDVASKYLEMKDNVEAYLEAANRVGEGNWFTRMFNDPMSEDLKDLSNANREKKVAKAQADRFGVALKKELKKMLQDSGEWKDVQESWSWDKIYGNLTESGKADFRNLLGRNATRRTEEGKQYWEDLIDLSERYKDALYKVIGAREEVDKQMSEAKDYWYMALEEKASLNHLDFDFLAKNGKEEDVRKVNQWINDIVSSMEIDPETSKLVRENILESLPKGLKAKIEALPVLNNSGLDKWQEQLKKYFDDNKLHIPIDAQTSLEKVEKLLQEKKKSFQEQRDRGKGILIKFGADFGNLEASIEALKKKYPFLSFFLDKAKSDYTEGEEGVKKVNEAGKVTGLNVDGKTKKSGGGSKKDAALEDAKVQLDEVQKFYSEYKKYREVYGPDKGKSLVEEIFGMDHEKASRIINDYKAFIKEILDNLPDNGSDARKKFKLRGKQLIGEINLDDEKQQMDYILKELQEHISKQTSQWNLYKQLFEKTGDKDFAMNAFRNGQIFDDLSRGFENELKALTGESVIDYTMTQAAAEKLYKDNKRAYELWKKIVDLTTNKYTDSLTKGADALSAQLTATEKIRKNEEEIARLRTEGAGVPGTEARIRALQKDNDKLSYEAFQQSADYLNFFGAVLTMANDDVERIAQSIKDRLLVELAKGNISAHQYMKALKDVNQQLEKGRTALKGRRGAFLSGGQKGVVDYREQEVASASIALEAARKHREQLERQREAAEELDDQVKQDLDDWIAMAILDEEEAKKKLEIAKKLFDLGEKTLNVIQKISVAFTMASAAFEGFSKVGKGLSEMFEALGNDSAAGSFKTMANSFDAIGSIFSPVNNLVQNALSGNVGGMISSVISAPVDMFTAPITAFAKMHDAALQEEIEASQARQKEMESLTKNLERVLERTLGGFYNVSLEEFDESIISERTKRLEVEAMLIKSFGKMIGKNIDTKSYTEELKLWREALESNDNYKAQKASLMAQRKELERQMKLEKDKKDSDASAIQGYKDSIQEIDDEIKHFAEDMAKAMYDIDLKSWAQELTDAIVEAWENGENAAEAYKDKVKEIMKDLTKNILAQKIMEKAFENAGIDKMIAEMMDVQSGKLNESNVGQIADALLSVGETSSNAILSILDEMEKRGYIDKDGSGSSSSSAGIKSITENTADLICSYLQAIRADVSVNRATLDQILVAVQTGARVPVIAEAQLRELQTLVTLARERNGFVGEVRDVLHRIEIGQTSISVK